MIRPRQSSDFLTERSQSEVEAVWVVRPGVAGGGDPLEGVLLLHPVTVLLILPPVRDTEHDKGGLAGPKINLSE